MKFNCPESPKWSRANKKKKNNLGKINELNENFQT